MENAPTLHIGWNRVVRRHNVSTGSTTGPTLYFVHSYVGGVPAAAASDAILAETERGVEFASAVARGNLLGVQFHPERSGDDGLRLLANFVSLVRAGGRAAAGVAS